MLCNVPRSISLWFGIVTTCLLSETMRAKLTWLPFCRLILKLYCSQKTMTSLPESRLSLGIKRYRDFVVDKNRRSSAD